jgi:hypothetical protein
VKPEIQTVSKLFSSVPKPNQCGVIPPSLGCFVQRFATEETEKNKKDYIFAY